MRTKKFALCLVLLTVSVFLGCVCNAQQQEELTKQQRLENTLYLQNNNYSAAKDGVLKVIDPEDKSLTPLIMDGVLYIPLRFTAESFGIGVDWDDTTKSVLLSVPGKTICFSTSENTVSFGGNSQSLDRPCLLKNGHTLIALDDLCKLMKFNIYYYSSNRAAVICVGEEWDAQRAAEKEAHSAMEFAVSPFFKMFT